MEIHSYHPDSSYVDQALYDGLVAFSADLRSNPGRFATIEDTAHRTAIEALLLKEALLLDEGCFDDWLELYAQQCIYWVPAQQPAADPREQITLELHDRRRLLDRVTRLKTGAAFSQIPPSRTVRIAAGLCMWPAPGRADVWHARSNFIMSEFRVGKTRHLSGWYGFSVQLHQGQYQIGIKQINLLDCDAPQGNNSFFL